MTRGFEKYLPPRLYTIFLSRGSMYTLLGKIKAWIVFASFLAVDENEVCGN